jgi:hypothetical protein
VKKRRHDGAGNECATQRSVSKGAVQQVVGAIGASDKKLVVVTSVV